MPPSGGISTWRVFPWDRKAPPGDPYSAEYVPVAQSAGRFDLDCRPPVLYLAETPEHAVAEKIQRYRGQQLTNAELREFGLPLAIVEATITLTAAQIIVDLNDPRELVRYGFAPDKIMSKDRPITQGIARKLHTSGVAGFRNWSALSGDWHSTVLFLDRLTLGINVTYDKPVPLDTNNPAVRAAARFLAVPVK